MLDQKAAEVGGVMPVARKGKALNPVMNHGGARIGAYGAQAFDRGQVPAHRDLPAQGRPADDPPRPHRGRHGVGPPRPDPPRAERVLRPDRQGQARLPGRDGHGGPPGSHRSRRRSRPTRTATASSRARISSTPRTAGVPATARATSTATAASTSPTCRPCSRACSRSRSNSRRRRRCRCRSPSTRPPTPSTPRPATRSARTPRALHPARRARRGQPQRGPGHGRVQHPGRRPADDPAHASASSSSTRPARRSTATRSRARTSNTDPVNSNALPGIEIRGNGDAAKESIFITNTGTTIRGLALNRMWKTHLDVDGVGQHAPSPATSSA